MSVSATALDVTDGGTGALVNRPYAWPVMGVDRIVGRLQTTLFNYLEEIS